MTNIVVAPAVRRSGIGTLLMSDLATAARRRGCVAWTLEVRASNAAAQELYRRFGFVPAGVRTRYYENTEDAIVMWCHDLGGDAYAERLARLADEGDRRAAPSARHRRRRRGRGTTSRSRPPCSRHARVRFLPGQNRTCGRAPGRRRSTPAPRASKRRSHGGESGAHRQLGHEQRADTRAAHRQRRPRDVGHVRLVTIGIAHQPQPGIPDDTPPATATEAVGLPAGACAISFSNTTAQPRLRIGVVPIGPASRRCRRCIDSERHRLGERALIYAIGPRERGHLIPPRHAGRTTS